MKALTVKGKLGFWESGYDEIICPQCGEHYLHNRNTEAGKTPFGDYCHTCEQCGYVILGSEYN
ncbi:MAG: hypothetical protein LBT50_01125 [Prevotellaceae bacterium]|jgi:uncharacterized Zn finger protein|nr:hypothetical protein [Prevotellaceae bacterium]